MGCHSLLQEIFLSQGSNPHLLCLLHCGGFFTAEPLGKPEIAIGIFFKNFNFEVPPCDTDLTGMCLAWVLGIFKSFLGGFNVHCLKASFATTLFKYLFAVLSMTLRRK